MVVDQDVRLVPLTVSEPDGPRYQRAAFTVFAFALAMGTLIHEWNSTVTPWVAIPSSIAAVAVLVRPGSVLRFMALLAALVVECVRVMPIPVNHQLLMGLLGTTLGVWWLGTLWLAPRAARDPAALWTRIAPFLRLAFILMWVFAALAKLNAGFLDTRSTCAVWILESIPLVAVPHGMVPVAIVGTLATELSLPILLSFHRTRPLALMVALPFHAMSALAGHSWFSGFAWAFYALFLPPVVLARGTVIARELLPDGLRRGVDAVRARPWLSLGVGAVVLVVAQYVLLPGLGHHAGGARNWGAVLACLGWMAFTAVILWRLRSRWFPGVSRPRASLVVRNPVLLLGLLALVVNGASPYLGLKTEAAFTMFSNVRTEPGHWNPLLVPESARVFGWLDGGDVRFVSTDDPGLRKEMEKGPRVVLLGARRLAQQYPRATVRYTLDGVPHVAAPVSSDPVLGRPLSMAEDWYGATRSYADGGTCQH